MNVIMQTPNNECSGGNNECSGGNNESSGSNNECKPEKK